MPGPLRSKPGSIVFEGLSRHLPLHSISVKYSTKGFSLAYHFDLALKERLI